MNVVVNTAIARSTTREMLAQFDQRVRRFRPDLVVLMSGINDCADRHAMGAEEFRANLLEFVRRAHDECGAEMILQTGCAVAGGTAGGRGRYPAFMDIVREVAGQTASVLADHHADWEATLRRNPAAYESWMSKR